MSAPGFGSTLKVSGASTVAAGEATTLVTGTTYQVNTAAKRILDPAVAVVVKDGGTPVAGAVWNYLFGRVTLPAPPAGVVTVDISWLAMLAVAEVTKASLKGSADQLEKTSFDSAGYREYLYGLRSWEAQAEMWSQPTDDLDAGTGGVQSFFAFLNNGTPKLLEVKRAGKVWRGWCLTEKIDNVSERDSLVTASVGFKGSPVLFGASLAFEELLP